MEKYINILRKNKKEGKTIKIDEFYKQCQEDGFLPPRVIREVIKNNLQDVLVK